MQAQCNHRWIKNGSYRSRKRGAVQRWVCTLCGQARKDFERYFSTEMARSFGLLGLGLALDQVELLVGVKSETMRKGLMSAFRIPECWAAVREEVRRLGLNERDLERLESTAYVASLTGRFSASLGPHPRCDLARVSRCIGSVLGSEVVVGVSRQGVRACSKETLVRLIRKVWALPTARLEAAGGLSPPELSFVERLRSSATLTRARLHALLDARVRAYDQVTQQFRPVKVTVDALAAAMGVAPAEFIGTAAKLAHKLRSLLRDPA